MYVYKIKLKTPTKCMKNTPQKSNETTDTTKYSLTIVRKSQKWTAFV